MHYKWESVGDQDECIRKVCYLGPYLLEHVEKRWEKRGVDKWGENISVLMMASKVWLWNDRNKIPELVTELEEVEFKPGESTRVLEDWYALNVLAEELFTGVDDGPVRQEKR